MSELKMQEVEKHYKNQYIKGILKPLWAWTKGSALRVSLTLRRIIQE